MLTIATSTDGENWTRPMLDLVPYGNASRTNILLKLGSPTAELSQISVFANATAPAGSLERYAMFLLGSQPPQSFLDSGLGVPASCAAWASVKTSRSSCSRSEIGGKTFHCICGATTAN